MTLVKCTSSTYWDITSSWFAAQCWIGYHSGLIAHRIARPYLNASVTVVLPKASSKHSYLDHTSQTETFCSWTRLAGTVTRAFASIPRDYQEFKNRPPYWNMLSIVICILWWASLELFFFRLLTREPTFVVDSFTSSFSESSTCNCFLCISKNKNSKKKVDQL